MADIGSAPALFAAQPAIIVDGEEQTELSGDLISLVVEEQTAGLYRCEATFSNWGSRTGGADFVYFARDLLDFGTPFAVRAGGGASEAEIFSGRIMALEAHYPMHTPAELVVLAEDRFQDLRMTRRTRTFEQVSDRDAIEQIARNHNLQTEIDADGPTHPVLAQLNQSDLAFIRERARAIDAEVWLEGKTLHAQARGRREAESITLTYRQGLLELSMLADLAEQRTEVTISGWDVTAKEAIEAAATESAISQELNGHISGVSLLASAMGQRKDHVVHHAPFTSAEARHLADAHFRVAARRFVTGRGVCSGDGRLRVGGRINFRGVGPLLEGEYYVTAVRHVFDGLNGYRTHFSVERPGIGK